MTPRAEGKGSILVTGANGGLGSAIVAQILNDRSLAGSTTGLYAVRKAATANALKKTLKAAPPSHKHEIVEVDLGSIASVRATATKLNQRVAAGEIPPIRTLILNAGYQDHNNITMSDDGIEMTWHVNFLANQLLVLMLLQSMDKAHGRILLIGSWSHDIDDKRNSAGGLTAYDGWDTLFPGAEALAKGEWSRPGSGGGWYAEFRRYGASKLCAVMLMHELAERLGQDPELSEIRVLGLDPGGMSSDLMRRSSSWIWFFIKNIQPVLSVVTVRLSPNGLYRTTDKSAQDVHRICWEIEPQEKGRLLYLNGTDVWQTSREAEDEKKRRELWEYGLKVAGFNEGETVLKKWQ